MIIFKFQTKITIRKLLFLLVFIPVLSIGQVSKFDVTEVQYYGLRLKYNNIIDSVNALITTTNVLMDSVNDLNDGTASVFNPLDIDIAIIDSIYAKYMSFDTSSMTPMPNRAGIMWYDSASRTVSIKLESGVVMQVGQEMPIHVKNVSGVDIDNGQAVYIIPSGSDIIRVSLADKDDVLTTISSIGLATSDIPHGGSGYVNVYGLVRGLSTNDFEEGDCLYLGNNGSLTNVKPTTGHIMAYGMCMRKHNNDGTILVFPKLLSRISLSVINRYGTFGVYLDTLNGITLTGDTRVWDDLRFPATRVRQGALSKPDFDYDDIGLLFPDDDTTEIIYITAQMPHAKDLGTDVELHIHYIQSTADSALFGAAYRWYDVGEVPPAWTVIYSNENALDWSSGDTHNIAAFPSITGSDSGVSSIMDLKIWRRTQDAISGDVLVKDFDLHIMIDKMGSPDEY